MAINSIQESWNSSLYPFYLLEGISERAESLSDFDEARAIELLVTCLENLKKKHGFDHRSIICEVFGLKPLHYAASKSCLTLCKSLIESGANLEEKTFSEIDLELEADLPDEYPIYGEKTPLHFACASGQIHIVRELIKRGANTNAASNKRHDSTYVTPLLEGANNGEIILELARNGADINEKGMHAEWAPPRAPYIAVWKGSFEALKTLFKLGVRVNQRDYDNWLELISRKIDIYSSDEEIRKRYVKTLEVILERPM